MLRLPCEPYLRSRVLRKALRLLASVTVHVAYSSDPAKLCNADKQTSQCRVQLPLSATNMTSRLGLPGEPLPTFQSTSLKAQYR
jgi:hypothetical protein